MNRNIVLIVLCLVIAVTAVSYSQVASLPKRWYESEQVISKYVDANDVYLASQTARAAASLALRLDTINASITSTLDVGDVNATRADITNASVTTRLDLAANLFSIYIGTKKFLYGNNSNHQILSGGTSLDILNQAGDTVIYRILDGGSSGIGTTTPICRQWIEGYWGASMPIVIAYAGTSSAIVDSAYVVATFTTDVIDTHNCLDVGGGTFTAPIKGLYQVEATIYWANSPVGLRITALYKNGAAFGGMPYSWTNAASSTSYLTSSLNGMVLLSAGDTISVLVYQNSGAPIDSVTEYGNALRIRCVQQLP